MFLALRTFPGAATEEDAADSAAAAEEREGWAAAGTVVCQWTISTPPSCLQAQREERQKAGEKPRRQA